MMVILRPVQGSARMNFPESPYFRIKSDGYKNIILPNPNVQYAYCILSTLFDRSPTIARQWTVARHSEAAAAGRSVEEHDRSNGSFKRMTNEEV